MVAPMRPPRRKQTAQPTTAFTLPSHWSSAQALAVFECIELLRGIRHLLHKFTFTQFFVYGFIQEVIIGGHG